MPYDDFVFDFDGQEGFDGFEPGEEAYLAKQYHGEIDSPEYLESLHPEPPEDIQDYLAVANEIEPLAGAFDYPIPPLTTVVISGSRSFGQENQRFITEMVKQLIEKAGGELWIHCGDAEGVDQMVIAACEYYGVRYTVWHVKDALRESTAELITYGELRPVEGIYGPNGNLIKGQSYVVRDKAMVKQSGVDKFVAVWDGKSRGTLQTMFAVSQLDERVPILLGSISDNRLSWQKPSDLDVFNWAKDAGMV